MKYDVIVVGSGAGCSAVACRLAEDSPHNWALRGTITEEWLAEG